MGDVRVRFPTLELFLTQNQGALATSGRRITPAETQILSGIFGLSVNFGAIRVAQTIVQVGGRAYTLGSTIRFPMGASTDLRTLVHETAHVWQYQTKGADYISDSIWHQATAGQAAYDVTIVPGQSIHSYHAEQQATIVERYYANDPPGWATNPDVLRMIAEVRRARAISTEDIQLDILSGPARGAANPFLTPPAGSERIPQVMPLIRVEF